MTLLPSPLPPGISAGFPAETDPSGSDLWLRWPAAEFCAVRVVSSEVCHYRGHWYPAARAFRLCTAPPGHPHPHRVCLFCPEGHQVGDRPRAAPAEWRFFLSVQTADGQQRIWEFSQAVARLLTPQVAARGGAWAGLTLRLSRAGGRGNGAVSAVADLDPPLTCPLPGPYDVLDAPGYLAGAWGRAALKDGKAVPAASSVPASSVSVSSSVPASSPAVTAVLSSPVLPLPAPSEEDPRWAAHKRGAAAFAGSRPSTLGFAPSREGKGQGKGQGKGKTQE